MPHGKRKTASDQNAEPDAKKTPNNELHLIVEDIQKSQKSILEKLETQQRVLEKLEKSDSSGADNKPSFNSVISSGCLMKNATSTGTLSTGRSFVLKHTFKDVSKLEKKQRYCHEVEDHFGVSWRVGVGKKKEHLAFLMCCKVLDHGNWAIKANFTFRVAGANGKIADGQKTLVFGKSDGNETIDSQGVTKFIAWEDLEKEYLVEDKLAVEVHVEIVEMNGVYKENLRCFDESMKDVSDVVLVVGEQKFYISKLCLATHSSYFKTLCLGNFQESNQSEIRLTGICAEDFQNYLEVLYGDPSIDDTTVEGILLVADMYDTTIVIEKCIDFLVKESAKSTKKKLQMAIRYNLEQLKKKLIANMKTLQDIKSVMPKNPEDLDHSISVELLSKSLSLR